MRVAIRHAPALQDFVDVELLISADGSCDGAAVVFDREIPVDGPFRCHLKTNVAMSFEFMCK